MPKVLFLEDFDYSPAAFNGRSTTAYKAGQVHTVTTECWQAAKALKKAKLADKPQKTTSDEQN